MLNCSKKKGRALAAAMALLNGAQLAAPLGVTVSVIANECTPGGGTDTTDGSR